MNAVQDLLNKSDESRKAAELLLQEGYVEFSVARAYYAMFYIAEALLLDKGLAFSTHGQVIGAYGKEFAKTGLLDPKFHRYLKDAFDFRNKGDYDILSEVSETDARNTIQWAEEFLTAARGYLAR